MQRARGERADPTHPRLASILPEADRLVRPGDDRPARAGASSPTARCPTCRRRAPTSSTRSRRRSSCSPASPPRTTPRSISIASRSSTRRCTARRSRCWRRRSASKTRPAWWRASRRGRRGRRCTFRRRAGCSARAAPGFRFDNEAEPHPVDVPEFEIDAQAVTWAQYGEFVEDGGYDERAHWSADGWDWLQREGAAHAAPRRPDAPRRPAAALRRARARRRRASRRPRQLARGRRLVPLGRAAPAERSRVGSGRAPGRHARLSLGRRARVDGDDLPALSGLRRRPVARLLAARVRRATRCCAVPRSRPGRACAAPACAASRRPSATTASSASAAAPHSGDARAAAAVPH